MTTVLLSKYEIGEDKVIVAINYADEGFCKAQKLNLKTALQWGADKAIAYTPADIDEEFRKK